MGVLDVDLNGPCVAAMLGMRGATLGIGANGAVAPEGPMGVKVASMAFLVRPAEPVRWCSARRMRYITGSRMLRFGDAMLIFARSVLEPSGNSPARMRPNRSRFSSTDRLR